jgi:hypothetical protein
VSLPFSLHALAAQKMPQLQNHLRRHAAGKPAIHARRSKTNPSNSQTAGQTGLVHSEHFFVVAAVFCCDAACVVETAV